MIIDANGKKKKKNGVVQSKTEIKKRKKVRKAEKDEKIKEKRETQIFF